MSTTMTASDTIAEPTAHAAPATAADLTEQIAAFDARRAELDAQATTLQGSLAEAKRRLGRAIADRSAEHVQQACRAEVRAFADEIEGVDTARQMIEGDRAAAAARLASAQAAEARADAEAKVGAAVAARNALVPLVRVFVAEQLRPALEAYRAAEQAARSATHAATTYARREGLGAPSFASFEIRGGGVYLAGLEETLDALERYYDERTDAQQRYASDERQRQRQRQLQSQREDALAGA